MGIISEAVKRITGSVPSRADELAKLDDAIKAQDSGTISKLAIALNLNPEAVAAIDGSLLKISELRKSIKGLDRAKLMAESSRLNAVCSALPPPGDRRVVALQGGEQVCAGSAEVWRDKQLALAALQIADDNLLRHEYRVITDKIGSLNQVERDIAQMIADLPHNGPRREELAKVETAARSVEDAHRWRYQNIQRDAAPTR